MPSPRKGFSKLKKYLFDPRLGSTGRYVDAATGRIVSQATVTDALEAQIDKSRQSINTICKSLANGNISLAKWQLSMRSELKTIHTISGALGKGGWAQMAPADWLAVARSSKEQYRYLQRFANEIADGKQKLFNLAGEVNGQFLRRADLYGQAGNNTYNAIRDRQAQVNGNTEERRILDPGADHCDCCVEQAALGWQPIGTLKPIGACTCLSRCRCEKEYR